MEAFSGWVWDWRQKEFLLESGLRELELMEWLLGFIIYPKSFAPSC